jgi:F0F1-type ATP synthase gamma subunit
MTLSPKLADLIKALEVQSDYVFAYLDRETSEVIVMTDELLSLADYEPEKIEALPDWQKDQAEIARQIETTDRYLALPDRFEVNEWEIMRDFCEEVHSDQAKLTLQNAIHGNHAFRRFKDQLATLNLQDPWTQFRQTAFEQILRVWCEENNITLVSN